MSAEDVALKALEIGATVAPHLIPAIAKLFGGGTPETAFEERVAGVLRESLSRQAAERVEQEP